MKRCVWLLIVSGLPLLVYAQNRFDIVIDEIMADPSPQAGLPNAEWVELKNTSGISFNLLNWRIGDASGQSGPLPAFVLQPDSFVIVCAPGSLFSMSAFGTAISVSSFPSLGNDADQVFLRAANGKTIHSVSYSSAWYDNEVKKEGGWTLEMIDPAHPCVGKLNWKASIHSSGGTPGKKNAIDGMIRDTLSPRLRNAYTTDSVTIILVFDEAIDSLSGADLSHYIIDGGKTVISAETLAPLFQSVKLGINSPLPVNKVFNITISQISDCKNNLSPSQLVPVGLPSDPAPGDWVINEIVFDPRPNGYDYVEFYNLSQKIFDAARLFIGNGGTAQPGALSVDPFYVFPGGYLVVTENKEALSREYFVKNPASVSMITSVPSFPDDAGHVIVYNFQGVVLDELKYKDDWHFKLIEDAEGVALERIDPAKATQDEDNWHSAASTAGFGTPGYKNSQYRTVDGANASIELQSKIFSPDNDGYEDIVLLLYKMTEPGYVANIIIYDAAGRAVRYLVLNGIIGTDGYWTWNGLDDKGQQLPMGVYIFFTEIFNLKGKKERFKNAVVLARKL
jgi:hypothetical protein